MGGTLNGLGATPLTIGGTDDHVHLLIGLRATHAIANLVRETKKASTWVRAETPPRAFPWQEGYAALSVGKGERETVVAYTRNQEANHRTRSSSDELHALLEEARIEIDERFFG